MKTCFIAVVTLFFISFSSVSQESVEPQKPKFDKNRIELGGTFGLALGDYTTINIAPQVGYAFNKYFSAGTGISYTYFKYKPSTDYKQTQNYLGLNVYGRVRPIPYIALQVQPEAYYMWGNRSGLGYNVDESLFVPTVLMGGGVILPTGKGAVSMMLYYDVVQYKKDNINYSPYGNQLVYSVGYVFNF